MEGAGGGDDPGHDPRRPRSGGGRLTGTTGALLALLVANLTTPTAVAAQATAAGPGVAVEPPLVAPAPALPTLEPLPPGVTLETHLERYSVRGANAAEIAASLLERAPSLEGRQVWGRTEWRLESHYRYGPAGEGCVVAGARVDVTTTVLLPDWRDRGGAPPELRRSWDAFQRGLVAHEAGHRWLAVEAGAALREALLELSAPFCARIRSRADRRTREIMEAWGERQLSYDVATRGGGSQGAVWPPRGGRP